MTRNSYYDEIDRRFLKGLGLDQTSPSDQPALQSLVAGYTSENNFFHLPLKTVDNEELWFGILLSSGLAGV